jgi:hypothetical protein
MVGCARPRLGRFVSASNVFPRFTRRVYHTR